MAISSGPGLAMCLLLLELAHQVQGDTCYSRHSGFMGCANGCCGPSDDQNCCSQTFLIVGLAVGAVVIAIVMVLVVVCWACKDCQSKMCGCCGNEGRRRREEQDRRWRNERYWRNSRARRVVVHPVQPPDYSTATQDRAPSVQPGRNHRIQPLSPPPPYIETVPPPPSPSLQNSPSDAANKIITTAPSATSLFVVGNVARSSNRHNVSNTVVGQSSNDAANTSSGDGALNSSHDLCQNGHSVLVVQPVSGSQSVSSPSVCSPNNTRLTGLNSAPNRPSSTVENTAPNEAPIASSPPAYHLIQPLRGGGSRSPGVHGASSQESAHGSDNHARGAVLDTVSETAEEGYELDLV